MPKLEDVRIKALPPSFFYIPDFITAEEESLLLDKANLGRFNIHAVRQLTSLCRSRPVAGFNCPGDVYRHIPLP